MAPPPYKAAHICPSGAHSPAGDSYSSSGPQGAICAVTSDWFLTTTSTEKVFQFGAPPTKVEPGIGADTTATLTLACGCAVGSVPLLASTPARSPALMARTAV